MQTEQETLAEIAAFDALAGTFFDGRDNPERLTLQSPEEALEQAVEGMPDGWLESDGCDGATGLMAIDGIRIDAWEPKPVTEEWKIRAAQLAMEAIHESFDEPEEYGPMDGPTDLTEEQLGIFRSKARELVDTFLTIAHVWQCEKVGSVEVSRPAIRAILEREDML